MFALLAGTVFVSEGADSPSINSGSDKIVARDNRLQHTILVYVAPTGSAAQYVRGHDKEAIAIARKVAKAVMKRREQSKLPRSKKQELRTMQYPSSEELYEALYSPVVGAHYVFKGTCERITNQYPDCTDINDPGLGVTWRKDQYGYFKHCVPDDGSSITCNATYQWVGNSYFYPDEEKCKAGVGMITNAPIYDYFCDE